MPERDFPIGHPAASDYKGEHYEPPTGVYSHDFRKGHPARGGKNTSALDTPDGMRKAQAEQEQDLAELVAIGAIPTDNEHEADTLCPGGTAEEKALAFVEARGYSSEAARSIVAKVGADVILSGAASADETKEG